MSRMRIIAKITKAMNMAMAMAHMGIWRQSKEQKAHTHHITEKDKVRRYTVHCIISYVETLQHENKEMGLDKVLVQ